MPARIADLMNTILNEEFEMHEIQVAQEEPNEMICGFFFLMNLKILFGLFSELIATSSIMDEHNIIIYEYATADVKLFRALLYYEMRRMLYQRRLTLMHP